MNEVSLPRPYISKSVKRICNPQLKLVCLNKKGKLGVLLEKIWEKLKLSRFVMVPLII